MPSATGRVSDGVETISVSGSGAGEAVLASTAKLPQTVRPSDGSSAPSSSPGGNLELGDMHSLWIKSVRLLQSHLDPEIFAAWIKPLSIARFELAQSDTAGKRIELELAAPSRLCCEHVEQMYGPLIISAVKAVAGFADARLTLRVEGGMESKAAVTGPASSANSSRLREASGVIADWPERSIAPSDAGNGESVRSVAKAHSALARKSFTDDIQSLANGETQLAVDSRRKSLSVRVQSARSGNGRYRADTNLNPKYNFSNFVVGGCNQFAHAVGLRVSQDLGTAYNPLFVYGGVGLGKTHLVNAIGNSAHRSGKSVLLVSSEVFVNEVIAAIRSNKMQQFKSKFRSLDVLIIDDVQFLIGKERTQEEFFHTFNDLYHRHRQIVITSDKTPRELVGLEERLRTRFASGLSVDLQAPDFETRVAILCKKAEAGGVNLPEEVAQLLAAKIDTNVRELEGALNRLLALSALQNVPITLEFAREALRSIIPMKALKEITFELIQRAVSVRYGVSTSDLLGKRRTQNIAFARHVAMYLCRRMTGRSFPEIGALFGGRDHSTVIHATQVINERMKSDPSFAAEVEALERELRT